MLAGGFGLTADTIQPHINYVAHEVAKIAGSTPAAPTKLYNRNSAF